MKTCVLNIGLNKGDTNEKIDVQKLDRHMDWLQLGPPTCIPVRIPQGEKYTEVYGVKVYEDTNIYILQNNWVGSTAVREICNAFEQDAIPFAVYDEQLKPIYTELVYSDECIDNERFEWGTFDPQYFATPIKGDLTNL